MPASFNFMFGGEPTEQEIATVRELAQFVAETHDPRNVAIITGDFNLFVQRPLPEHTFRLEVSRIRRRPFQHPLGPGDSQPFLSDHLGLEVTLFISTP